MAESSPENAADRAIGKRIAARVKACGGCPMCTRRVEGWGVAACGLTPQKSFPKCVGVRNGFELDERTVTHADE